VGMDCLEGRERADGRISGEILGVGSVFADIKYPGTATSSAAPSALNGIPISNSLVQRPLARFSRGGLNGRRICCVRGLAPRFRSPNRTVGSFNLVSAGELAGA
jgi:hypothetical protein